MRVRHSLSWSLLVLILLGIILVIGRATKKIDYIWQWQRMPRYILFKEQIDITAEDPGTISSIRNDGKDKVVILRTFDGKDETYRIPAGIVQVYEGDDLDSGDIIGSYKKWAVGILLIGLWLTLKMSFISVILAVFIGLITGLARISSSPAPKWLAIGYIELIRGTPLLVQLYIFYFFIGQLFSLSNEVAGILALSFFAGAYVAEIVRAGIQSIHRGQMEAARSLGMTYPQAMQFIILPQAFKRIMPPLAGQFISLIKDSSLVSIIAITDLTKAGREIATSTFSPFEAFFTVAALYLVLTFSLSMFVQYLERRYATHD
ncbi:MAG: amino acid ABC transporter permease [Deltaproteobacteria bacterium]|nr:amino acid ABC transporter permease [Deltaproteobacteria bacterium]